jgi:peptide/nickel transport system substrate-binding protein
MRRLRPRRCAALCLAVLALACGERDAAPTAPTAAAGAPLVEEGGPPQRGDWLVIHQLSDPENLNPLTSNDAGSTEVLNWILPSLIGVDPATLEQRPMLAEALPTISSDFLSFTFRLRPGITFSDGRPMSAEDVVFTLKAILNPAVQAPHLRNYFDSVADAVALDEHTVEIRCRKLFFRNPWDLGGIQPLPRHYYDPSNQLDGISVSEIVGWDSLAPEEKKRAEAFAKAFNEDFQRRPMGPGAYVLANPETDWKTGERIVLTHRDDFWAPGRSDLGDGWVDRIVFRIVNDMNAALVGLKGRDIDVMGLTPIQYMRETNSAKFKRQTGKNARDSAAYGYIAWNQRRPAFADRRVRQALSHLVDRRNLIEKVMFGLAVPVEGHISPLRKEYNRDLEPWPFDPERARALLAEAGWSDSNGDRVLDKEIDGKRVPLRFEIISNAGNDQRKQIGLVVIDEFKRQGIDASFRSIDWSIMLDKVRNFDFDAVILGWVPPAAVPPDAYQVWHSSQAVENGSNYTNFRNAEVDSILERYREEFDEARRIELYRRFQEILYEEQPYTFLFSSKSLAAWDLRFRGVKWYPGMPATLEEWWVPARLRLHP